MIPITTPFSYEHYERETSKDGSRVYITPEGNVPSVTTIIGKMSDKTALDNWRNWVGHDNAAEITKEAANLGTLVHTHLEKYIKGEDRPKGNNPIRLLSKTMSDSIINNGLSNINEIWCMEQSIRMPGLYAGTIDLCGIHKNEPAIIDFKTTKKPKKKEWVHGYKLQMAAYSICHNYLYNTNIRKIVILMSDREGKYSEFEFRDNEYIEAVDQWLDIVEKYYAMNK